MKLLSALLNENTDLATLAAELDVPVLAGLQHQGDVSVVPASMIGEIDTTAATPVPASGVVVVRGENGGHTHLLMGAGDVRFDVIESSENGIDLGVLSVADGATAYLDHLEHGNSGIAPGTYMLRSKREQADEVRRVAD